MQPLCFIFYYMNTRKQNKNLFYTYWKTENKSGGKNELLNSFN